MALRHDPDCVEALLSRGLVYLDWSEEQPLAGKAANPPVAFEQAIAALDRAARLEPKAASVPVALRGACYLQVEKYGRARRDLDRALAMDEKCVLGYLYRAQLHTAVGEDDKAVADYTALLRIDPENAEALFHRGLLYLSAERYAEADKDLRQAVKLVPELEQFLPGGKDKKPGAGK